MLHHWAEHNFGDASTEPVGAARQCQGETLATFAADVTGAAVVKALLEMNGCLREWRTAYSHFPICSVPPTDRSTEWFICVSFGTERDVPSSDLHHPGGDDGDREGEEHEAAGPVHPQTLLRQRNLPPQTPQPAQTWVHTSTSFYNLVRQYEMLNNEWCC